MKLAIGIKALNEEKHIASAIRSALAAIQSVDGEVVLADSGSTDRTIDIARQFPIRIVQLADTAQRCCGAGAQLAFQSIEAEYFYLLDGDMILDTDFVKVGIDYLDRHPQIAAVGGHIEERNTGAAEFRIRADNLRRDTHWRPGVVDRLDCGGLYRVTAIREAGYFADRNLHAFEEFELAARLRSLGWTLERLDHPAAEHFGHVSSSYRLLWRRLRSGYAGGAGEVLRGAIGNAHLPEVLRGLSHVRHGLIVILWWCLLAAALFFNPLAISALALLPVLYLSARRRSLSLGLFSFASWNVSALGLITGFIRKRVAPSELLASRQIDEKKLLPEPAPAGRVANSVVPAGR